MSGACAVCMRCRVGIDEQMCFLCEEVKETSQFVKRNHWSDEWRCLACANPPCGNPECNSQTATVPSHLWPNTKEELANFRCLACRKKSWNAGYATSYSRKRTFPPENSNRSTCSGTNQRVWIACILLVPTPAVRHASRAGIQSARKSQPATRNLRRFWVLRSAC